MVSELGWEFETMGCHFAGEKARIRFTFVNHALTGELWLNVHAHGPESPSRFRNTPGSLFRETTGAIWQLMAWKVWWYYRG